MSLGIYSGIYAGTVAPWIVNMANPARWTIVAVYVFVAWKCLRVTQRSDAMRPSERNAWRLIALVMILLALTRLIDWPAMVIDVTRHYAARQGWYVMRAVLQISVIAVIFLLAAVGVAFLLKTAHALPRATQAALFSTILLVVFFAIRAVSLHTMDVVFSFSIAGLRLHWVIELAGIAAVCTGAHLRVRAVTA